METIKTELNRRTELAQNPAFIKMAAAAAPKMGITAKEWNENKAAILLMMANEICKIENREA